MKFIAFLFIVALCSCNTVKKTETTTQSANDFQETSSQESASKISEDNVDAENDNATWKNVSVENKGDSVVVIDGYSITPGVSVTIETGHYNRDKKKESHKTEDKHYNVFHHINITKTQTVTITKTTSSRFPWLPAVLFGLGGALIFLASRVPLIVALILNLINLVIQKFKKTKKQTP